MNQEPILKFFIEWQASLPLLLAKRTPSHMSSGPPFPPTCLDAPKGIFNVFSPKHIFSFKKKKIQQKAAIK